MINKVNSILGITETYKAPEKIIEILYNKNEREKIFKEFLREFNYDVSYDWFRTYFESEHADRKNKKQDFTPSSVGKLVSDIVGESTGEIVFDGCAGTGGLTIEKWHNDQRSSNIFDYKPSDYLYVCEEISERAFPFLLFNLAIRGMNAIVIHCDSISRKCFGVFYIHNEKDDFLAFSNINRLDYSKAVEKQFAVKFIEKKYKYICESVLED